MKALKRLAAILRFVWTAGRGYRLRPWKSPYLRWRIETYWGWPAASISAGQFWRFLWRERRRLARYLAWVGEMGSQEGHRLDA